MASNEHYFSYGSNMGLTLIQDRGATVITREPAVLHGYRLTFDANRAKDGYGFTTIIPDPQAKVYGVLYKCKQGSLTNLDHGHLPGNQFRRETVGVVKLSDDKMVDAVAYVANDEIIQKGLKPSPEYYAQVLEGSDILPGEYVEFLKTFCPT